jgi:hypothetical protein
MPTVIDSLVVLLKLDPSEFTEGQKKAAADLQAFADKSGAAFDKMSEKQKKGSDAETKQAKERLAGNKVIAESYKAITDSVLGWATAVISTAAIVDFAKNTTQMDASLGRFAERLDLNKDQLALWVGMLNNVTGNTQASAKSVQQSADALNNVRQAYMLGDVSKTGVVQALGLSMTDLQDPLVALDKIHKNLVAMHMSNRVSTPLLQSLGIDTQTISVLQRGNQEYGDWMDAARRSVPATKEAMQAAEDATRAWGQFDGALNGLANDILVHVLPGLSGLVGGMTNMAQQTAGPMEQFTGRVGDMLGALAQLGQSSKGDGSLNLFGKAFVAIFGTVHVALMGLGALIYGLIDNIQTLANAARAAASGDWAGVQSALAEGAVRTKAHKDDSEQKIVDYTDAMGQALGGGGAASSPAAGSGGAGAAPAPAGGLGGGGGTSAGGRSQFAGSKIGSPYQNAQQFFSKLLGRKVVITAAEATSGHARNSEHYTGDAWDFKVPGMSNEQAIALIKASGVPFDELFDEQNHVHMGFRGQRGKLGSGFGTQVRLTGHQHFAAGAGAAAGAGGDTHSTTTIGTITINTKATDAKGIASELPGAIAQAGRGLT